MPNYRMRSAHGEVAVPKEQVDPLRKQGWVLVGPVPEFQTSREVLDTIQQPDFRSSNLRDEQGQPVVLPEPTRMRATTPEERVMNRLEEDGDVNALFVRRQFDRTPNQPQTARPTMRAATFGERLGDSWADTLEAIKPAWIRAANAMTPQTPDPFSIQFDPTMGSAAPGKEGLKAAGRGLYSRIDDLLVQGKIGKKGVSPARLAKLTTADRALAEEAQWRGLPDLIEQAGGRKTTQRTISMDQLRGHLDDNPAPIPVVKTLGVKAGGEPSRIMEFPVVEEYIGSERGHAIQLPAGGIVRVFPNPAGRGWVVAGQEGFYSNEAAALEAGQVRARNIVRVRPRDSMGAPTQYSQYQIPGGENYRETLLTLPPKTSPQGRYKVTVFDISGGGRREATGAEGRTLAEAEEIRRTYQHYPQFEVVTEAEMTPVAGQTQFVGQHFTGEKNVIAHSRSNERLTPTGWVSHSEEFQSDPHQKARDLVNDMLEAIRERTDGLSAKASRADILRHATKQERTIIESGGYQGNLPPETKTRLAHIAEAMTASDAELDTLGKAVEKAGDARLAAMRQAIIARLPPEWRERLGTPGEASRLGDKAIYVWRKARDEVYANPPPEVSNAFYADRHANEALTEAITRRNTLRQEQNDLRPTGLAPNIPFKETWPDLAAKQWILEEAANPRSTGLSFTSGDTQARRYGAALAQAADRLEWQDLGDGKGYLTAFKGQDVVLNEVTSKRGLTQYIGKDAAQQLLSAEVNQGIRRAEVKNLRVGGAGMRSFYDENRPPAISKILAPFGIKPFRPSTIVDATRVDAKTNLPVVEPSWFTGWTEEQKAAILKKGLPMSVLLSLLLGRPPQAEQKQER